MRAVVAPTPAATANARIDTAANSSIFMGNERCFNHLIMLRKASGGAQGQRNRKDPFLVEAPRLRRCLPLTNLPGCNEHIDGI
jgi:hypothetical protein